MTTVALCALLAAPALGHWQYDGTTVSVGEPDSASDPYNTWSWWYDGGGSVDSDAYHIYSTADISGGVGINYYASTSGQRSVYARNWVRGTSNYHWVGEDTPTPLTATFSATISSDFSYNGYAINYLGTSPANCSFQVYTQGGGNSTIGGDYASGLGGGTANSEGGSTAENSWYGIEPSTDDWDYGQGQNNDGYCEGEQHFSGNVDFPPYEDTPWGFTFSAIASLDGLATAQGHLVRNSTPAWGGFEGGAGYEVYGTGYVDLDGDIVP
jgi:hypothetical protein